MKGKQFSTPVLSAGKRTVQINFCTHDISYSTQFPLPEISGMPMVDVHCPANESFSHKMYIFLTFSDSRKLNILRSSCVRQGTFNFHNNLLSLQYHNVFIELLIK